MNSRTGSLETQAERKAECFRPISPDPDNAGGGKLISTTPSVYEGVF